MLAALSAHTQRKTLTLWDEQALGFFAHGLEHFDDLGGLNGFSIKSLMPARYILALDSGSI